jgi:hypothetical protein
MKLRNAKHEEAAQLVSEDRLIDLQIAEKVGISRQQLTRWKLNKAFAARVEELTGIWSERALRYGLARREKRLAVLSDMHNRLLTIIEKRGTDPELAGLWNGAGATGLVVRSLKGIGKDENYREVEVREVDTGILKEIRGLQEQISKELGQYVEQVNVTVGLADQIAEARQRLAAARALPLEITQIKAPETVN